MRKAFEILSQYVDLSKQKSLLFAKILISKVIQRDVSNEFIKDIYLNDFEAEKFIGYLKRFNNFEPISKIIMQNNFYGIDYYVDKNVLDPRCDSEIIIDAVIELFKDNRKSLKILDLGVGSGCLLLTLLKIYKDSYGVGIDISEDALAVSKKNAEVLNIKNVKLLKSNWFSNINKSMIFDVIVSNPPYIKTDDIPRLGSNVKDFDPFIALDGGEDGLKCYREIFKDIKNFLSINGLVFVEIGYGQKEYVVKIAIDYGLKLVKILNDISNIERVLVFSKT